MSMLSVITLRDLITAHAALDSMEMEHYALVNPSQFMPRKLSGPPESFLDRKLLGDVDIWA